jgi:hypothetical protein
MTEPKCRPVSLDIKVSGEVTRFSRPTLVEAYVRLVPPVQRGCRPPGSDAAVPAPGGRLASQDRSLRPARR